MQVTFGGDEFGRVIGTIAHDGAQATVTSSDSSAAIQELREAIGIALDGGTAECFWHEAAGDYRWLFRREGAAMRVAILWSIGAVTGWEHVFWAECDAGEFRDAMLGALAV